MKPVFSNIIKIVALFICFQAIENQAFGQEEKFKALFIYNFTKYIEWQSEMGGEYFNIAVVGNQDLYKQLSDISSKMKVGTKKLNVTYHNSSDDISVCQIVYFGVTKTDDLSIYAKRVKGGKVLIIGDKDKACQKGACINFIKKNGNLNYEISSSNMESSNLKYNSTLSVLGNVVD
jgi:hypothetical protein